MEHINRGGGIWKISFVWKNTIEANKHKILTPKNGKILAKEGR